MDTELQKELDELFSEEEDRTFAVLKIAKDASLMFNTILKTTGARDLALMSTLTFVKSVMED